MIKSFRCKDTQMLFETGQSKRWIAILHIAERKLTQLDKATVLRDLASPPGNRLETLFGDREGQYSIRINERWRLCFRWAEDGPRDVEIVDYH
jgi:proteic killer suppression protein